MIIKTLKIWMDKLITKIYSLSEVIYIKWLGYEWFIEKDNR